MTSAVGPVQCDESLRQSLQADAFCSSLEIITGLGHLGWDRVHPITSNHERLTKHSARDSVMEQALGMATSGRRAVLSEVE